MSPLLGFRVFGLGERSDTCSLLGKYLHDLHDGEQKRHKPMLSIVLKLL